MRANPGATTRDILDHINPTLRKNPGFVIVHCGTNDLPSQEKTIAHMQELIRMSKAEAPDTELVMSSIITRRDKPGLQQIVNELNTDIKISCLNNQIKIMDNSNLNVQCLGRRQLHLSKRGNGLFVRNLLNSINNH